MEKTTLGDIAEYIEEMYTPQQCYLSVKLDLRAIEALQLGLTNEDICRALINCKKLKLKTGVRCKVRRCRRVVVLSVCVSVQ